jgi:hypothetical protein
MPQCTPTQHNNKREKKRWVVSGGGDLTNVLSKSIQNCHNETTLYNEYILIKMKKRDEQLVISIKIGEIYHTSRYFIESMFE